MCDGAGAGLVKKDALEVGVAGVRAWVEQGRQDQSLGRDFMMALISFPPGAQRAVEAAR